MKFHLSDPLQRYGVFALLMGVLLAASLPCSGEVLTTQSDEIGRLRSVDWPGQGGWQYNLDKAGNVLQIVRRGPLTDGGQLNDTGTGPSQCYGAGSSALIACDSATARTLHAGQDGMVGRDTRQTSDADGALGFSFLKIDATGRPLPSNAPTWACVKDLVTGLVWENKTADGGAHDGARRFNGYADGRPGSSSEFAQETNAEGLCGFNDWRVPSRRELIQLIHMGQTLGGVQLDTRWHDHMAAAYHWSSDPLAGGTQMWVLDFSHGGATAFWPPIQSHAVRVVRGPAPTLGQRFVALRDGSEVLDQWTSLVWQRCPLGMAWSPADGVCTGQVAWRNHEGALAMAEQVRQSSQVNWRLPSIKELESTVALDRTSPAIDSSWLPTPEVYFWSSTPVAAASEYAWCIGFIYGSTSPAQRGRNDNFTARLVRDAAGDLLGAQRRQ